MAGSFLKKGPGRGRRGAQQGQITLTTVSAGEAGAVGPGTVLGGKYRLMSRIGRGGMGEVWSAADEVLHRTVAVKIVLAAVRTDPELMTRLRLEARAAASLQHPGITVVHDIGDYDGHPFLVMELLEGSSFEDLLLRNPAGMPVPRAVELMTHVADALAHAHRRGIVHRDVKPANLIETVDGRVKICDFGVSRYAGVTTHLTAPGIAMGSPPYMAPEQYRNEPVNARTDLYAFGCTLYALLIGRPPFVGPSLAALMHQHLTIEPTRPAALRSEVSTELDDLVLGLLAKDPADRPGSAADVRTALMAVRSALVTEDGSAPGSVPRAARDSPAPAYGDPGAASGMAAASARSSGLAKAHVATATPPGQALTPILSYDDATPPMPAGLRSRRGVVLLGALITVALTVPAGVLLFNARDNGGRATPASAPASAPAPAPAGGQPSAVARPAGVRILTGHTSKITTVAFAADGRTLATASWDRTARLWDLTTGYTAITLTGHGGYVAALAMGLDGRTIATGCGDRKVRLWTATEDRNTGTLAAHRTATLTGHTRMVVSAAFGPAGRLLATASYDGTVRLWDAVTGRAAATLTGHAGEVSALAFRPDGGMLATSGWDRTVRLWDVRARRAIRVLTGHLGAVQAVAFSPDSHTVATGGDDRTVRLWDPATGRTTATLTGHTGPVRAIAFSPDSHTLATGGDDRTVRLWDLTTGRTTATLTGHTGPVRSVAFSPDGRTLAGGGDDATVRLWPIH